MTKILAIVCSRFREDYALEGHLVQIPTKPAVALLWLLLPALWSGGQCASRSLWSSSAVADSTRWRAAVGRQRWQCTPLLYRAGNTHGGASMKGQAQDATAAQRTLLSLPTVLGVNPQPLTQLTPPWSSHLALPGPLLPSPLQSILKAA